MTLQVYTDGGSLNNPGNAASAYLIFQNGSLLAKETKKIGIKTNNIAEYQALIMAWEKITELINTKKIILPEKIEFFSDSQLMVNQLLGKYRVKDQELKKSFLLVRLLSEKIKTKVNYIHVLREKNSQADALVKQAFYS